MAEAARQTAAPVVIGRVSTARWYGPNLAVAERCRASAQEASILLTPAPRCLSRCVARGSLKQGASTTNARWSLATASFRQARHATAAARRSEQLIGDERLPEDGNTELSCSDGLIIYSNEVTKQQDNIRINHFMFFEDNKVVSVVRSDKIRRCVISKDNSSASPQFLRIGHADPRRGCHFRRVGSAPHGALLSLLDFQNFLL